MTAGLPTIEDEVSAALRRHGVGVHRMTVVSPLAERKGGRLAFRVDMSDGVTLKARHVVDAETASELRRLRDGLEPGFAPVIDRVGAVLVEEWITGDLVGPREAEGRAAEAGALLGRLHSTRAHGVDGARCDTAPWRAEAISDLEILRRAGRLTREDTEATETELRETDPGTARTGLIHRDFCPENFVVDSNGRLVVVDNEWLMIGVPEFDLGRTLGRWPMSEGARERFLAAHASAWAAPQALGFWCIAATLMGARVLHERLPERIEPMLALLRRVARLPG